MPGSARPWTKVDRIQGPHRVVQDKLPSLGEHGAGVQGEQCDRAVGSTVRIYQLTRQNGCPTGSA